MLNGANETAVQAFLDGKISLGQVVPIVEDILSRCPPAERVTIDALLSADRWARREAAKAMAPVG